jgi:hypothetical protein
MGKVQVHISDVSCASLVRLWWWILAGQRGRAARQLLGGANLNGRRDLTGIVVGMVI